MIFEEQGAGFLREIRFQDFTVRSSRSLASCVGEVNTSISRGKTLKSIHRNIVKYVFDYVKCS